MYASIITGAVIGAGVGGACGGLIWFLWTLTFGE